MYFDDDENNDAADDTNNDNSQGQRRPSRCFMPAPAPCFTHCFSHLPRKQVVIMPQVPRKQVIISPSSPPLLSNPQDKSPRMTVVLHIPAVGEVRASVSGRGLEAALSQDPAAQVLPDNPRVLPPQPRPPGTKTIMN